MDDVQRTGCPFTARAFALFWDVDGTMAETEGGRPPASIQRRFRGTGPALAVVGG